MALYEFASGEGPARGRRRGPGLVLRMSGALRSALPLPRRRAGARAGAGAPPPALPQGPMALVRLYGRVIAQLGPEARTGVVLVLANLALACAQFAEPVLFGKIIDLLSRVQGLGRGPTSAEIWPLIAAWIGFGLFIIGASVLVSLHADRLAHRRRLGVTADYFAHVLQLPLSFHARSHSGGLLKIMLEGAGSMGGLWLSFFRDHAAAIVTLIVLLPASLYMNWRLGLLLFGLAGVFAVLSTLVLRKTQGMQGEVEKVNTTLAEQATDALGNVPVIQSFTRIEQESVALRSTVDRVIRAQMPVLSWWAVAAVATRASATLTVLSILVLGTALFSRGLATVGDVVTFMTFSGMLISRLDQVVSFINNLVMIAPKLAEFFEIIDTVPDVHDRPNAIDAGRAVGRVAFEDVTFSYDGRRPAVEGVSFTVEPGETVALVGSTGSGKSTTLGLLHRAFDPQSGRVTVDGQDIRDLSLSSLRRNIGVVFQEPMLFARTIDENLRIGRPEATPEEVRDAVERAQAAEFIDRQSDGINTIVGERGRSLSGGERQRLSIARALIKDPPIMILDEATSALDAATERKLQRALDEVRKGRTTFVIAHRLATIRNADRILVFDKGRVIEAGTFDELVARRGRFAELAAAQFMAGAEEPAGAPTAAPALVAG